MRIWSIALSGALFCAFAMSAAAQAPEQGFVAEPRCWVGSKTYSPNTTLRAANQVMICTETGEWAETDQWSAGCIYDDKFHSTGAIVSVSNIKIGIVCVPDGTWTPWQGDTTD